MLFTWVVDLKILETGFEKKKAAKENEIIYLDNTKDRFKDRVKNKKWHK